MLSWFKKKDTICEPKIIQDEKLKYSYPTKEEFFLFSYGYNFWYPEYQNIAYRVEYNPGNDSIFVQLTPEDCSVIINSIAIKKQNEILEYFWDKYNQRNTGWDDIEERLKKHHAKRRPKESDEDYKKFTKQAEDWILERNNTIRCPKVEGRIISFKKWKNKEIIYGGEKWYCKIKYDIGFKNPMKAYIKNEYDYDIAWGDIGSGDQKDIYEQITRDMQDKYCSCCKGKI